MAHFLKKVNNSKPPTLSFCWKIIFHNTKLGRTWSSPQISKIILASLGTGDLSVEVMNKWIKGINIIRQQKPSNQLC